MKAKFVNEAFEKKSREERIEDLLGNTFEKITWDIEDMNKRSWGDMRINKNHETIGFDNSWNADDDINWEFDTELTYDFKHGKRMFKGDAKNVNIEVPGPGYMQAHAYYDQHTDKFNRRPSIEEFIELIEEDQQLLQEFEHVAKIKGRESLEYCSGCGMPSSECACEEDDPRGE